MRLLLAFSSLLAACDCARRPLPLPDEIFASRDLARPDLSMARDLSSPPDLATPDLAAPRDLSTARDLSTPDLAKITCGTQACAADEICLIPCCLPREMPGCEPPPPYCIKRTAGCSDCPCLTPDPCGATGGSCVFFAAPLQCLCF